MDLSDRLQNVAVLGAAGKMGSGISLLLARDLAMTKLAAENKDKVYRVIFQARQRLTSEMGDQNSIMLAQTRE
jgi:3-hydroxyacyl-CoA dehydrogenase